MGILSPVLVATAVEATRIVIVDGFKRVRIATDRGDAAMWVRRSSLDATGATGAMVAANAGHSGLCELEETWIVRSLCRDHRLTQVEVGKALRRDKSWMSRRLMLAERREGVRQDDIRLGLLAPTVARELARLPRGNQVRICSRYPQPMLTAGWPWARRCWASASRNAFAAEYAASRGELKIDAIDENRTKKSSGS